MLILFFNFVDDYLDGAWDRITEFGENLLFTGLQLLRTCLGHFSAIIYDFIVDAYELFVTISKAEILNNSVIQGIYENVGLLLGLFMVFKLTFSLIQYLIEPKLFTDSNKGFSAIIQRFIISIVLLGVTPFLFRTAFDIQKFIVGSNDANNNILYKLIVGERISTNVKDFGRKIASDLYFSFYTEVYDGALILSSQRNSEGELIEVNYDTIKKCIEVGEKDSCKSFHNTVQYLSVYQNGQYAIAFDEIFCILFGVLMAWILISDIIQVSIRVIQLAYLQIIAPVPILSYIQDPNGIFKRWVNQCFATYIDLFLRVMILYFVVLLCDDVMAAFYNTGSSLSLSLGDVSPGVVKWAKICILLGLLLFAKKAPELLKDLFPIKAGAGKFDFGLNLKKSFVEPLKPFAAPVGWLGKKAIGGVIGAVGAGTSNAIHGFINTRNAYKTKGVGAAFKELGKGGLSTAGGILGGAKAGIKTRDLSNVGDAVKVANENRERRALKAQAGYTWYRPDKVIRDKVMDFAGEATGAQKQIKSAEFTRDALQQSKQIKWENFARMNTGADLSLLRSMHEFEEKGKKVWKGIDSSGNERTFMLRKNGNGNIEYIATDGRGDIKGVSADIITESAAVDKQIKAQNKIIKGLQTADRDAKKK